MLEASVVERFWKYVSAAPASSAACWEWRGYFNSHGYGHLSVGGHRGRKVSAHRLSFEIHYGPIPPSQFVCHHCDNTRCVRPDHLFLGTNRDNVADMMAKGRHRSASRLTDDQVREIRRRFKTQTAKQVAAAFGCHPMHVWQIAHRIRRASVPDEAVRA